MHQASPKIRTAVVLSTQALQEIPGLLLERAKRIGDTRYFNCPRAEAHHPFIVMTLEDQLPNGKVQEFELNVQMHYVLGMLKAGDLTDFGFLAK
jgi:hypothetical protein